MSRGQFGNGSQRYRADVVNVQFNLGKTGNEALRNRHAASLSTSSCGHSVNIPRSVG